MSPPANVSARPAIKKRRKIVPEYYLVDVLSHTHTHTHTHLAVDSDSCVHNMDAKHLPSLSLHNMNKNIGRLQGFLKGVVQLPLLYQATSLTFQKMSLAEVQQSPLKDLLSLVNLVLVSCIKETITSVKNYKFTFNLLTSHYIP